MTFRIAQMASKAMLAGHIRVSSALDWSALTNCRRCVSTTTLNKLTSHDSKGIDGKIFVDWVSSKGQAVARIPLHPEESLLDAARREKIDLEGACDGSLACSTCHVVLQRQVYELLDSPSDHEADLLDLACGLERGSRLGCQVKLDRLRSSKEPIVVKLASLS